MAGSFSSSRTPRCRCVRVGSWVLSSLAQLAIPRNHDRADPRQESVDRLSDGVMEYLRFWYGLLPGWAVRDIVVLVVALLLVALVSWLVFRNPPVN